MSRQCKPIGVALLCALCLVASFLFLTACGETTCKVTFDSDGGTAVESQTVKEGGFATKPADPTKVGFTFDGWFYDVSEWIFTVNKVNSDITLKAKWRVAMCTVSFNTDGGDAIASQDVNYNTPIDLPLPVREDYAFDGWFIGEMKVESPYTVTQSTILKAKWRSTKPIVTFDVNGGVALASQKYNVGDIVDLPYAERAGYAFEGWYVGNDKISESFTIEQDVTLVAKWKDYNPDNDYNYYASKYGITGEVNIIPITFASVNKMFMTEGKYLLYIDSEDAGATARFRYINNLATNWNVKIYHFNPELSGGYASNDINAEMTNILQELTGKAAESQLINIKQQLGVLNGGSYDVVNGNYSGGNFDVFINHNLLAVEGSVPEYVRVSGVSNSRFIRYTGKVKATNSFENGASSIIALSQRRPGFGSSISPDAYITSAINTFNTYADSRLHIENDAFTDEKTDVFQTVANYNQLAHLLNNSNGKFAVLVGGNWCPNTQAIAKIVNDLAKDYGISKIYHFDFRLDDGARFDAITVSQTNSNMVTVTKDSAWVANLLTRNNDETNNYNYNFNYLYANLINEFLPGFQSDWITQGSTAARILNITSNGVSKEYSRMVMPAVLLFDGTGDGKAVLIDSVEAEYYWDDMKNSNSEIRQAYVDAIKALFEQNSYAGYNPVPSDKVKAPVEYVSSFDVELKLDSTSC
jgi:uncharacterized repeat protein (TIGR02543 family)